MGKKGILNDTIIKLTKQLQLKSETYQFKLFSFLNFGTKINVPLIGEIYS